MEIKLNTVCVEDAARMLENLAAIMQDSVERGNVAPELYASAFELIGGVAAAIRQEVGCAA